MYSLEHAASGLIVLFLPMKELIMVQREAAFLISCATEHFIRRIAEAAQRVAERERRTTVQAKDLGG